MLAVSGIRSVAVLASFCSVAILAACSGSDKGTGPSDGEATIQFANAHPGSNLVVLSNGTPRGSALTYKSSGNCHVIESGDVDFAFRASGSSTDLVNFHPDLLENGKNYTVFAAGAAATPMGLVLPDTFGTVGSGRAKLRIVNATHTSYRFDVHIGGTAGSPLTPATVSHANLGYLNHTIKDLPAGGTRVRLSATGFTSVVGNFNFTLNSQSMTTLVITAEPTTGAGFDSFLVPACPQ